MRNVKKNSPCELMIKQKPGTETERENEKECEKKSEREKERMKSGFHAEGKRTEEGQLKNRSHFNEQW